MRAGRFFCFLFFVFCFLIFDFCYTVSTVSDTIFLLFLGKPYEFYSENHGNFAVEFQKSLADFFPSQ